MHKIYLDDKSLRMLVRTTCAIDENSFFITVGDSCFYLFKGSGGVHLIDSGAGVHVPQLLKRLSDISIKPEDITHIHLSSDCPTRISGLPFLVRRAKNAKIIGNQSLVERLNDTEFRKLLFNQNIELSKLYKKVRGETIREDDFLNSSLNIIARPKSETFDIDSDLQIRTYNSPGYSDVSSAFYLPQLQFLIVDPTFGYFRGKELPAPGGNHSIEQSLASQAQLKDLEVNTLAFLHVGFISGGLTTKYFAEIKESTKSLTSECKNALLAGVSEDDILESLKESVYSSAYSDPIVEYLLDKSMMAVWSQINPATNSELETK